MKKELKPGQKNGTTIKVSAKKRKKFIAVKDSTAGKMYGNATTHKQVIQQEL